MSSFVLTFRQRPPPACGGARLIVVHKRIADHIEKMEPGVHDFAFFECRYGQEDSYTSHPFCYVRINNLLDPTDHELSDVTVYGPRTRWMKKRDVPLVLRRDLIAGMHLWFHPFYVFCSDEFHDWIVDNGLTGLWKFERQIEK